MILQPTIVSGLNAIVTKRQSLSNIAYTAVIFIRANNDKKGRFYCLLYNKTLNILFLEELLHPNITLLTLHNFIL